MQLYIGADHRGFELKEQLKSWLEKGGYQLTDCGNHYHDPADDYPDFAIAVGEQVVNWSDGSDNFKQKTKEMKTKSLGIVICGSGVGASIAANKVMGIRAGHALSKAEVEHARSRDQINVLSLSADYLSLDEAKQLIETFLTTKINNSERDQRRINKISNYEILGNCQ